MDLITTHINADFDALGSLVAARKLYPGARLLLPGSPEEAVAEFLSLSKELITVESERECRLDDVDRLILVDTRHRSRIGPAARLVDAGVETHIYDHHPRMKDDIVADREVFEEVGASVSILADIIRKRRLPLTGLEATVMLLGIYEETGSLTFRSTTKLDVDMVSFLLSKGANLSVVSRYLNRELSESEVALLVRLIETAERTVVNGVTVTTIVVDEGDYVGELGTIIHKLMDIENLPLLFVFIRTGHGRIDIVSRGRLPAVDLNKVMARFGGGGHPAAACAKVPGGDLEAMKAKLMKALSVALREKIRAKDIMSKELGAIAATATVADAKKALAAGSAGGAPVRDRRGRIVGVISQDGLNKALKSGFGHSPVKGYMSYRIAEVTPAAPLHEIRQMMRSKGAGVILVRRAARGGARSGKILGVIRRTDVLKHTCDDLFLERRASGRQVVLNLSKKMTKLLPREIVGLARRIGRLADAMGYASFLVGGSVRDLLLGTRTLDLDVVVEGPSRTGRCEGEAIVLGRALAKELGAALVIHKRFGTCTVVWQKRLKIDLATARKETYERPAALPTVEFSSLKDDLVRRDFTINAMAVSLGRTSFGRLIDFFNGQGDLARRRIRVLHEKSFIDDPTRIFRAVRFEQRLGFSIDAVTADLIKHAMREEMFEKVEPQRIRDEIMLILQEEEPLKALRRMDELHELRFLHKKLRLDRDCIRLCHAIEAVCRWYEVLPGKRRPVDRWLIYLMALFGPVSYNEMSRICQTFVFRRSDCLRLLSYKKSAQKLLTVLTTGRSLLPSAVYRLLEPLSFEVTLLMMARAVAEARTLGTGARRAQARMRAFLEEYNGVRITVRGDDIKAMGLTPGPVFRKILEKVLYAKIDGKVRTKDDELALVGKLVKRDGRV